jgi:hypothetical protein
MADEEKKCGCDLVDDSSREFVQFKQLFWVVAAAALLLGISLWISPYLFDSDPESFWRYILLKFPYGVVQAVFLLLMVCLADFIMPRDSLDCIAREPVSNAIFYSALIIALAIIMAFG